MNAATTSAQQKSRREQIQASERAVKEAWMNYGANSSQHVAAQIKYFDLFTSAGAKAAGFAA